MKDDHQPQVPIALEQMLAAVSQLETVLGAAGREAALSIRSRIINAMAARDRGDTEDMIDSISSAMRDLATAAGRISPGDGQAMAAVAEHFRRSLLRGDVASAKEGMDIMFDQSGARYQQKKS